jgi:VanZ family protein
MTYRRFRLLSWFATFIWMGYIFYLSSQSTVGIGSGPTSRFVILKSFHLIEYAVLSFMISLSTGVFKTSLILSYLYAGTDEIHQAFIPGREGKWSDTLIDLIGIFIGLVAYQLVWPRIRRFVH